MKRIIKILFVICIGLLPKITLAETYDGEYSIDYLLRNYNVVTLGHKKNNLPFSLDNIDKGDIQAIYNIDGAVLVAGNFKASNFSSTFGTNPSCPKSFIKGQKDSNVSTPSELVTDSNYIDFDKLYANIMKQSQALTDNTEYHINSAKLEVSKPGVYSINNTANSYKKHDSQGNYIDGGQNALLINNYNKDSLYIFNIYNEYVRNIIPVYIAENDSPVSISLQDYIGSGKYTGNIIFNYPNAKYINIYYNKNYSYSGTIIAPNADVELILSPFGNEKNTHLNLIVNSLVGVDAADQYLNIKKINISIDKKLASNDGNYYKETQDYDDDDYSRDYSIKDLLENYSLITLGHKSIDSKSKLLEFGNTPGSVKLFHITGQALIAGDLYGKIYETEQDDILSYFQKFDRTAFDLESNKVTESFIRGNIFQNLTDKYDNKNHNVAISVIQPWDNMKNDNIQFLGKKNSLFVGSNEDKYDYRFSGQGNFNDFIENYLNFNRLYDNVVAEQSAIDEGKEVKNGEDKVTHIPIGGNYVIEDINDINEIVFDNFDEEKDKLTIITIKNSGDINFPLISKDTGSYKGIVTNDYYGKTEATHLYEQDTFVQDSYHGNIIWNVPNATYIKLKENAPFAGHLIAPNADVDTPETHFAGCFIVNSIYGEGNTEAHFYPITVDLKCDCEGYHNLSEDMKKEFSKYRLKKLLGGDKTIIEKTVLGDQAKYEEDQVTLEKVYNQCPSNNIQNPVVELLSNPKTYRNIGIIILLLGSIISYLIFNKKKIQTQK